MSNSETEALARAQEQAWQRMDTAPKGASILLLGLLCSPDGVLYDIGPEVRRVGYFDLQKNGWFTADGIDFVPRLWTDLPAMPADAITYSALSGYRQ